ncbi:uncharacterized protein PgNI_00081 [Pyricularia grisea]|uniref:Uncharacterized protein n=1 Tax=Pyricularia grisea TaxID=148305 RepID=A0A6P8BLX5_PYRGI|nr:uncharacterized protein PgNI_00081 [Pyricularia grisea]TLD17881.1 hypothetical protein PgNI_00081 [Pyricularia grisea]
MPPDETEADVIGSPSKEWEASLRGRVESDWRPKFSTNHRNRNKKWSRGAGLRGRASINER